MAVQSAPELMRAPLGQITGSRAGMRQRVAAAQYVRMSTEHQQYSIDNQIATIREYAEKNRFTIVKTYSDPARSGVELSHRRGLQSLLEDVTSCQTIFQAILVYDVSRWGRFQDTDESAHYEFICKSCGVPVYYCAEPFSSKPSLPDAIFKALKRSMAAEFSREMSVKTFAGQKRIAQMGFRAGGPAPYGYRRLLISRDGSFKQILAPGEFKSVISDRVVLAPGPEMELDAVRTIFRLTIEGKRDGEIISELDRRGCLFSDGTRFTRPRVHRIVRLPVYMGCHVWGQTAKGILRPHRKVPSENWVKKVDAFPAIISSSDFEAAQDMLRRRGRWSDQEMLICLKRLYKERATLTSSMIAADARSPAVNTYISHFGSIQDAYQLAGYKASNHTRLIVDHRRRTHALLMALVANLGAICDSKDAKVSTVTNSNRSTLRYHQFEVLIVPCWTHRMPTGERRWVVRRLIAQRADRLVLLARLDDSNSNFHDYFLLHSSGFPQRSHVQLRETDPLWRSAVTTRDLRAFPSMVLQLTAPPATCEVTGWPIS